MLASLWYLHRAEAALVAVGRKHDTGVRFFHGRGGSLSRGAGPPYRFLSALPHGAVDGGLRLTEQGETISQKYGDVTSATYNLELLAAGAAVRTVLDARAAPPPHPLAPLMEPLAEASRCAYEQLVQTDGFLAFFRQATPIDVLESSRIGSRPARRSGQRTLSDLRAIPWVFSWSQARFALTGWYGVGSALEALAAQDAAAHERLVGGALQWPLLRYVLSNASVSVLTVDPDVFETYAGLVEDGAMRARILSLVHAELARTRRVLEQVYGGPLERVRPRIHRLLALRSGPLHVLHREQVALLRAWRAGGAQDEALLVRLLGTVNAIAAGLRTTG
jgi:phosphoenolpyruvate carboxylase